MTETEEGNNAKADEAAGATAAAATAAAAAAGEELSNKDEIAERLTFFFSDANIRQDVFMRRLLLETEGTNPGMVPIESLLKFNTIKKYTTSAETLVKVAKSMDDLLTVSHDEKAIGKKDPFTLEKMDDNLPLSLLVNNIPVENKKYKVSTDELRDLFQGKEHIVLVKLRFGGKQKIAIGSALVEFDTVEHLQQEADDVLTVKDGKDVEPKRPLKLKDSTLSIMLLKEFIENKRKRKAEADDNEQTTEQQEDASAPSTPSKPLFTLDWKPGCVVSLKGVGEETCDRESILAAIAKALDITEAQVKEQKIYVDYSRGQVDGAIRFPEPSDNVKAVCAKLASGVIEIAGNKVGSATILEGDDEKEYWDKFIEFKNKQMKQRAEDRSSRKKARRSE